MTTATASARPDKVAARAFSAPAMPEKLVIDGTLSEWSFDKGRNSYVAVDSNKVALAIAWDSPPESGISFAFGARFTPYPQIGWVQRAGYTHDLTEATCEYQQIPLTEGGWENGPRNPPEVAAACKRLLTRHQKSAAEYRERFVRRYRLTATGLESLDGPAPAWLTEVRLASGAKGVEVELPLAALPELAEAPLTKLYVAHAEGALPASLIAPGRIDYKGSSEREGWEELVLDAPASFGPLGSLLAHVYPAADMEDAADARMLYAGSYHPGAPMRVREIGVREIDTKPTAPAPKRPHVIGPPTPPDRPSTTETEAALYTPWQTFGDLEVGVSSRGDLVTLKNGVFVAVDGMGKPDGHRLFEKDIHLFSYSPPGPSYISMWTEPRWAVVAVRPDGTIVSDLASGVGVSWDDWDVSAKEFHDKEWSSFGIQGLVEKKKTKFTWTWDPTEAVYRPAR